MTGNVKGEIRVFRHFSYEKTFIDQEKEVEVLHKTLNLDKNKATSDKEF